MSKIDDLNLAAEREAFAQHLNALSNPQLPALLQSVSAKYKTKPTLQPGSKGPAVIELQGLLIQVQPLIGDKTPISPDGDYGVKTATVVKAVQAKSGLSQTGVADAPTWVATVKIIERSGRKPLVSGQQAASAASSVAAWAAEFFGSKQLPAEIQPDGTVAEPEPGLPGWVLPVTAVTLIGAAAFYWFDPLDFFGRQKE